MKLVLPPARRKLPYAPSCDYGEFQSRSKNIQIRGANFKPTYKDITQTTLVLDERADKLTIAYNHEPTQHTVSIELHTAYDQLITYKTYVSGGFATVILQQNRDKNGLTYPEKLWVDELRKELDSCGKFTPEEVDKHVEEYFNRLFRKGKKTPAGNIMVNNDVNDTNVFIGRRCILNI